MSESNVEITQSSIEDFSSKLEEWGKTLPQEQQALLHMMLERGQTQEEDDVEGYGFCFGGLSRKCNTFFGAMDLTGDALKFSPNHKGGGRAAAWVQLGEPWMQSGGDKLGKWMGRGGL